ncbi:MAG: ABC transporter permease [Phycisphaerales bacterium]|jgi:putative ABC transport system permease protein
MSNKFEGLKGNLTATLLQDIRYGFRMLLRNPGFTFLVVLILAVGIGSSTAILSVVDSVLLRPLSFADPDRIMVIDEYDLEEGRHMTVSPDIFLDLQEQTRSFEEIAFFGHTIIHLTRGEFPESVEASGVSTSLFGVLGVKPLLGRTFLPDEDQPGKDHVAVISHGLWQRRFGSDPNLVGKTISFVDVHADRAHRGERIYTVVGIMPSGFRPSSFHRFDIWTPKMVRRHDKSDDRRFRGLDAVARLKPNVTQHQVQAEAELLAQRLAERYPEVYKSWTIRVRPLRLTFTDEEVQQSLLMLAGAVAFVLLIACANVASMLLARAATRQKEVAVRATLGAGRQRLIRQLLTESVMLSILGAALGALWAHWGIGLLKPVISSALPMSGDISVDAWTLSWTLLIVLATGVGFGLAPALQLSKPNLTEALKEGGGGGATGGSGRKPLRSTLVVCQVALALMLLIGAGLLIQTLIRLLRVDPDFEPHNLMQFKVNLPFSRYKESNRRVAFYERLFERIGALPGVRSVAAVTGGTAAEFPVQGQTTSIWIEERQCSVETNDYLSTVGIPLLQGRHFTREDPENNVIINETAARQLWPDENPIGKRLGRSLTVIGVVAASRLWAYAYEDGPAIYIPCGTFSKLDSLPGWGFHPNFVVRSAGEPLDLVTAIRREVAAFDSHLPVVNFIKLENRLRRSTARQRLYMQFLTIFAVIGLILAAAGIYGLISYSVARRTHEIGVRMALGAERSDVFKLVLKKGLLLIIVGLVIGVVGALALTRVLRSFLYGVTPTDPLTFVFVSLLLTVVGLMACYIPARRATKIDPMNALRYE